MAELKFTSFVLLTFVARLKNCINCHETCIGPLTFYCVDKDSFEIGSYEYENEKRKVKFWFRFDNDLYESSASVVTKDHFPNVTHCAQSTSDMQLLADEIYHFNTKHRYYYIKTNGKWKLLGLNQVWLGCAQSLCLYPKIDAALQSQNTVQLFRGKHFWKFKRTDPFTPRTLVSEARLMKPTFSWCFIDAAFQRSGIILIKDDKFYNEFYDETLPLEQLFEMKSPFEGKNINAAFDLGSRKVFTGSLNEDLTDVDAAVSFNKKVFVFKNWMLYTLNISGNDDIENQVWEGPHNAILEFYKCDMSIYKQSTFENFEKFMKFIERDGELDKSLSGVSY
ncbi:hypothetical protein B4U79_18193 [Dinothrombium tinctorium]|uniref:Uncharacterized protein n=1 Tax=Dinothrombium tinctorium TaxID=1965070 RepID=A0A3S3P953_9ACAR|nr:hypothetical protein B4U79_18193 [Dinothrombium tinctorium]